MASIADVFVTVLAETSKLAPKIKEEFRKVDRDAREAGARWGKEITNGIGTVTAEVDADTTKARAEIAELTRDREMSVRVNVDQAGLSRGLSAFGSGGGAAASSASGFGDIMTSIATKGPLAIAAIGGVSIALLDVAGIAASAAQSIIVLPALIGGVASAMGTLKLATLGFDDALSSIRDPEKFATALQSLSPAAQQAALAIRELLPAFDQLKNATQDAFFAGVGGMLNGLANQYLPTIQQATTGIAGAFNSMLQGVTNQLMTPETQASIQSFLANITQAFQNLAPAAAPFAKVLADLMSAGSGVLPGIAQAITNAAWAFSDFISKAKESGDLQRWLGEGLDTLKQLGQIVWDVGRAFLAMAPAGREILPTIVNFVNGLANVMPKVVEWANRIQSSFSTWAPVLSPAIALVDLLSKGIGAIGSVAQGAAQALTTAFTNVAAIIDRALTPIREAINLANMVPGVNIPQIGSIGPRGGASVINPTSPVVKAPGTFRRRDGSIGEIPAAMPILPTAGIAPLPTGGYAVPLPPPPKSPKGSSSTPNLPYAGTADPYGNTYSSGYTSDAALLAGVPAGRYDASGDLSKGLGDCSSAVEDLVNIMSGNPTAGRSMATGNAAEWLTAHGFQPGSMPGAFNVGYNSHHMQATLPGGTPFNWGSPEAAARGGVGGTGAYDPAFTSHYYLPVGAGDPMSSMYGGGGMTPGSGLTSQGLTLRNAQQRVNDTQHTEEQAQGRLNEVRAKGTATARQLADAEYDLKKAQREHQDAVDGLTVAQDKYNKSAEAGKGGDTGGNQLGQDIFGGIAQMFGFDGSLFQDPTQFGLFKLFKGAMGLKPAGATAGGSGASGGMPGMPGGGGGGLGGILGMAQNFMPGMPGGNSPNILDAVQNAPTGGPGSPGPGNNPGYQNSGVDLRGASFGDSHGELSNQLNSITSSQNRWGPMLQNVPK